MNRLRGIAAIIALLVRAIPAFAASDPALVAAAEAEGKLVVYSCDPSETPLYVKAFGAKYPKIKVTSYLAGCWQVYNRHANEHGAGRTVGSVIMSIDDVLTKLQTDGLLDSYVSPEVQNFPDFAHPPGVVFTYVKFQMLGLVANTDLAHGVRMPQDWLDFAHPLPEWANQLTYYDPRTSSAAMQTLATLYQDFGPEKTAAIYKGLHDSGADLAATTSAGLAKLLTGERPIMFYLLSNHYTAALEKGAPLSFTVPSSGAIVIKVGTAVLKDAPQPNAAKLFIDFMLSDEQSEIRKHGEYALRRGIAPPDKMPPLESTKLLPFDPAAATAKQAEIMALWKSAVGMQ